MKFFACPDMQRWTFNVIKFRQSWRLTMSRPKMAKDMKPCEWKRHTSALEMRLEINNLDLEKARKAFITADAAGRAVILGSTVSPAWLGHALPNGDPRCPWCGRHGHFLHITWRCPELPGVQHRPRRPNSWLLSRFAWLQKHTNATYSIVKFLAGWHGSKSKSGLLDMDPHTLLREGARACAVYVSRATALCNRVFWHIFWHFSWHFFWHIFSHIFWRFFRAYFLTFLLTYLLAFFFLAAEAWRCPLRSQAPRWGPALPTAIWSSPLRSGAAHCDLEFPVEARQCPLRSGAHSWGPACPLQSKAGEDDGGEKKEEDEEKEEDRTALIKSNNLTTFTWQAGKKTCSCMCLVSRFYWRRNPVVEGGIIHRSCPTENWLFFFPTKRYSKQKTNIISLYIIYIYIYTIVPLNSQRFHQQNSWMWFARRSWAYCWSPSRAAPQRSGEHRRCPRQR